MGDSLLKLVEKNVQSVSLAERGKLMSVEDIQKIYGKDDAGNYRKSRWWITHKFAQESKIKDGRDVYWWEKDVVAYFDAKAA